MHCAVNFDLSMIDGCRTVDLARHAGKEKELSDVIAENFGGGLPTVADIRCFLDGSATYVLRRLGLDESGNPLNEEPYTVFVRVTGICRVPVDAESPEDARQKAIDEMDTGTDYIITDLDREDIETRVAVAYERCHDLQTKDYDWETDDAEKSALGNALTGHKLWALVRTWKDACGAIANCSVKLFVSSEEANRCMQNEWRECYDGKQAREIKFFQYPKDGGDRCYIEELDGSETRWHLSLESVDANERFSENPRHDPKWLEDRLSEAVNMFSQMQDGESVDSVTCARSEKDPGKTVDVFMREVRSVYPEM